MNCPNCQIPLKPIGDNSFCPDCDYDDLQSLQQTVVIQLPACHKVREITPVCESVIRHIEMESPVLTIFFSQPIRIFNEENDRATSDLSYPI